MMEGRGKSDMYGCTVYDLQYSLSETLTLPCRALSTPSLDRTLLLPYTVADLQVGFTHARVADGVNSLLQLMGMCARLCRIAQQASSLPS